MSARTSSRQRFCWPSCSRSFLGRRSFRWCRRCSKSDSQTETCARCCERPAGVQNRVTGVEGSVRATDDVDVVRRGDCAECAAWAAGVEHVGRARRAMPTCLATSPTPSERSERWWRRRESNPRPRVNPRETLHAYPLLLSRARREEAAQNRRAPDPVNLAVRRRAAV